MILDLPQLAERVNAYGVSLFRLETLDTYRSASDGDDVTRYLRGEPAPDPERKGAWLSRLRRERAQGLLRQRVHVVRGPLSPYCRYECEWGYSLNSEAGEDIRILDLAEQRLPAAADVGHDFWLVDGHDVIRMDYDDTGRFVQAELLGAEALPRYRAARDALLDAAEPFDFYWGRHPEYHQVNNRAA